MLSEYAATGAAPLPAMGFEQGHGGRSYGLEEVRQSIAAGSVDRI